MFTRFISFAAAAALVLPAAFPKVVEGCSDPSYRFQTIEDTAAQRSAADQAKSQFCKTAASAGLVN